MLVDFSILYILSMGVFQLERSNTAIMWTVPLVSLVFFLYIFHGHFCFLYIGIFPYTHIRIYIYMCVCVCWVYTLILFVSFLVFSSSFLFNKEFVKFHHFFDGEKSYPTLPSLSIVMSSRIMRICVI